MRYIATQIYMYIYVKKIRFFISIKSHLLSFYVPPSFVFHFNNRLCIGVFEVSFFIIYASHFLSSFQSSLILFFQRAPLLRRTSNRANQRHSVLLVLLVFFVPLMTVSCLHLSSFYPVSHFLSLFPFTVCEAQKRLSPQRDYITKWKAYLREEGHIFSHVTPFRDLKRFSQTQGTQQKSNNPRELQQIMYYVNYTTEMFCNPVRK